MRISDWSSDVGSSDLSAGDDRDPDPAHADTHPLWGDGHQPAGRDAARTSASGNARHVVGAAGGSRRGAGPPYGRRRAGLLGLSVGGGERDQRPGGGGGAGGGAADARRRSRGGGPRSEGRRVGKGWVST